MATTSNHYDLIVLGSDIAGLVAAALVARRGKRVLVIPHGSAGGTYKVEGRTLPLRSAPVVHMGTGPTSRVWTELGLAQQVRRLHAPLGHRVHVVLPSGRVDLTAAAGNVAEEAQRLWPEDVEAPAAWDMAQRWSEATDEVLDPLLASDNALVGGGFWGRRFLARVEGQLPKADVDEMQPLPADHGLRRVGAAAVPWLQHLHPTLLGKAASLRLQGLWHRGPEDLPGGEAALRTLLLQRIELHSGEVKRDLRVAELLIKRSRVVGVSLLGKRDRYGCDNLIIATDPLRLLEGPLVPEVLPRSLLESLQGVKVAAQRFEMHVEIAAKGLSPALEPMAMCLPEGAADDPVGNTYVRVYPGASEDTRRLAICHVVPPRASAAGLRERLLDALDARGVLPFCHDHVRWMHSPHDGRPLTDARGRDVSERAAPGSTHPMDALYAVAKPPSLGAGVLSTVSGLKSMHFACRLTLPGLGLEGEFAAGTAAAAAVVAPARSPFSRSPLLSRA
jgi:hypothetical protein